MVVAVEVLADMEVMVVLAMPVEQEKAVLEEVVETVPEMEKLDKKVALEIQGKAVDFEDAMVVGVTTEREGIADVPKARDLFLNNPKRIERN